MDRGAGAGRGRRYIRIERVSTGMVREHGAQRRLEYLHHYLVVLLSAVGLWLLFEFTATSLQGLPWSSVLP